MQSKSTPPHDDFTSTDAENIDQRVRNGRAVAYSWSPDREVWRATFSDCDCLPRSVQVIFDQLEGLDHAADDFLSRDWTPADMRFNEDAR